MHKISMNRTRQLTQPTVRPLAEASLRQVSGGHDFDNGQLARRAVAFNEPDVPSQ